MGRKRNDERALFVLRQKEMGCTYREIGAELGGLSRQAVHCILKRRPPQEQMKKLAGIKWEIVAHQLGYINERCMWKKLIRQGRSTSKMAEILGVAGGTVRWRLKKLGIKYKYARKSKWDDRFFELYKWLILDGKTLSSYLLLHGYKNPWHTWLLTKLRRWGLYCVGTGRVARWMVKKGKKRALDLIVRSYFAERKKAKSIFPRQSLFERFSINKVMEVSQ